MKIKTKILLIPLLFLTYQLNSQVTKHNSVGLTLGNLGLGIQAKNEFSKNLNFRINASFLQLKFNKSYTSSGILTDRTRTFKVGGIKLLADWKFLDNADFIWLSGGLCYQFNQFNEIRTFVLKETSEDLGNLDLTVKTFPLNPYLGILLGKHDSGKKISYFAEVGTLFHGKPQVEFLGAGRVEPTAEQDDIIQENLKNYNFYPVINFNLNYKIN